MIHKVFFGIIRLQFATHKQAVNYSAGAKWPGHGMITSLVTPGKEYCFLHARLKVYLLNQCKFVSLNQPESYRFGAKWPSQVNMVTSLATRAKE